MRDDADLKRHAEEGAPPPFRDRAADGEHPWVTLRDVCSRPRPHGHVVVFANEKGGVGKSTLAFHFGVALAHAGHKVLAVDLDARQHTLSTALTNRDATARSLQLAIPSPRHFILNKQSGAMLCQEIARVGSDSSVIVIDVAGHDSAIARYVMAMADTIITPVNSSAVDLDLLGKFDPVTMRLKAPGHFARLVNDLRTERARRGMAPIDWMVVKNRVRSSERRQQVRIDSALQQLSPGVGFRLGDGFSERVAYRELFLFGLTHLDLRHIPGLAKMRATAGDEILALIARLNLPPIQASNAAVTECHKARASQRTAAAYGASLQAHMQPRSKAFEQAQ